MASRHGDPFADEVGDIHVPITYEFVAAEPELFVDGDRFLRYLDETYETFDVITYSNSRAVEPPLRRIERLITNLPLPVGCPTRPKQLRVVVNNHAKLFLCYREAALQAAYIGSQNLSHGTQINLMLRAEYHLNEHLLHFFNFLWNKAKDRKRP